VLNNVGVLMDALSQHLVLTLPPIVLTLLLAIPIAWLVHRFDRLAELVITISALLYTIPSLPLFLLIPVMIGTGLRSPVNVIIALTMYGLALLVPAAVTAVRTASAPVADAATAVGFSGSGLFWSVQLPLAGPQILASLRVVSASTISLATLGSVLGVAGLGRLFTDGFQRGLEEEITAGLVLTVALALAIDVLLVIAGRIVMPWTRMAVRRSPPRAAQVRAAG
jgi:osmoprotectant transport system permease protein